MKVKITGGPSPYDIKVVNVETGELIENVAGLTVFVTMKDIVRADIDVLCTEGVDIEAEGKLNMMTPWEQEAKHLRTLLAELLAVMLGLIGTEKPLCGEARAHFMDQLKKIGRSAGPTGWQDDAPAYSPGKRTLDQDG